MLLCSHSYASPIITQKLIISEFQSFSLKKRKHHALHVNITKSKKNQKKKQNKTKQKEKKKRKEKEKGKRKKEVSRESPDFKNEITYSQEKRQPTY